MKVTVLPARTETLSVKPEVTH